MTQLVTIMILLLFYSLNQVASEEYYITANSIDLCTPSCLTLTEFVTNFSHLLNPDITLVFSPGIHYLNDDLTMPNSGNFTITSQNLTAEIRCERYSQVVFNHSLNVDITNLEFVGCGGIQGLRVDRFVANNATFRGQETALQLIETTAQIINCTFISNRNNTIIASHSYIDISQSIFENNGAPFLIYGGAILAEQQSIININASTFIRNMGIVYSSNCIITLKESEFCNNINFFGVEISESNITIEQSIFHDNMHNVTELIAFNSNIIIKSSKFKHNTGSVIISASSKVVITTSEFDNNRVLTEGIQDIILGFVESTCTINNSNFTNNNLSVIVAFSSRIEYNNSLLIVNNSALSRYPVIFIDNTKFIGHYSGNATISNNLRPLVAFNSNITFMGIVKFLNNKQLQTIRVGFVQEGGAITLVQSNISIDGSGNFENNCAENGGAILLIGSKLDVKGNVAVAHNTARNGGGVYLTESELTCQNKSTLLFLNNSATHKGGGVHAISSSIKAVSLISGAQIDTATLFFTNNTAVKGGGLSLEANAKLLILKYHYLISFIYMYNRQFNVTVFLANSAKYGGAIYVDDDTYSGTCTSDPKTECFFQVHGYIQGGYNIIEDIQDDSDLLTIIDIQEILKTQSLSFSENSANISGSNLYGGLLDRCAVSQFAEVRIKYTKEYEDGGNGIMYLKHVSTITDTYNMSISSQPVKVCYCINIEHNCTHQRHIEVKKGESFNVSLASIDQINYPVNGLIHASLKFPGSAVATGQTTREIPAECTNLTFNVVSPHSSEQLTLYALDGPCRDVNLSKISLDINFLPCSCPIGLQTLGINESCTCECHEKIDQYVEECDRSTGAFLRKSQSKAWIAFTNNTNPSGYLVYPNCPFDYCNSLNISIDLNQLNGVNTQCAFDRSSLLCGSCQPGFSLSLGSSRCLQCPSYWPAIFISITIAAILAGIALVALLLVLNMTVAVGTLNGLIFYANVVYANKNILFSFQETKFVAVFISWLNLELGIDICYLSGMDTFEKIWLQLAFPAYIILLVVLVIIISSYSSRFSNLIGKKNPVATLATLILLSYTKLLDVCFKSLSFGNLNYPDGSVKMLWLPDATVKYLSGKHIVLFFTAILVLLVGLAYTAILFLWQWILHLPRQRIFRWSRDQRLQTFIETYHTPYTPKLRYWTGLLLLARAVLYLVAAVNVSNNPTVALTAIFITVCCILALKASIGSRVYRKWPVDVLETLFYLNLLIFTTFTWYCLGECRNKKAAAYTSLIITSILLLLITLYHVYTYTSIFLKIKKIKFGKTIDRQFTETDPKTKPEYQGNPPPDDDIHRFHELLDMIDRPVNTNDYKVPLKQEKPVKPTQSVVEVHQPCDLVAPDPEEANA